MQKKDNNFITCTMVYPRYEWPFIYDWILYYSKLGVNNFLFGIDKTGVHSKLKGKEELKHKYYHLDKNDSEVNNLFFKEISNSKKINKKINIFTIDFFYSDIEHIINDETVKDKRPIIILQTLLHKISLNYSIKNNIDYIINIDIDEYIEINKKFKTINQLFKYFEKKYSKIEVFYIKEFVCSGRFDENGNYKKIKDIETKNKSMSPLVKWVAKPREYLIKPERKIYTTHKNLNTTDYIFLPEDIIWHNHYRGYKEMVDCYNKKNINKDKL